MKKVYDKIISHYEDCLEKNGDTHLGVDWPVLADVEKRYNVMLDVLNFNRKDDAIVTVLDFGCGTAHLLEHIDRKALKNIKYSGLDISEKFITVAKNKFPENDFYCLDILDNDVALPHFDFILMNGVFTEKRELSFDEMWSYFTAMLLKAFETSNKGIAFNVMSKNVDWERDDLFHVSHDLLSNFLCKSLTRNYIIRNDYGLYEYTVYVLKK
jgi:SAM-dependent methyltransferase